MAVCVVALEAEKFSGKFYSLADSGAQVGHMEQNQAADLILKSCIEECRVGTFRGDMTMPAKNLFDGWEEDLPELKLVKSCLQFIRSLENPREQKKDRQPWWIREASFSVALVDPELLKQFAANLHECKFFEFLLSNIVSGAAAEQFVELGQFLEKHAEQECWLLAWNQKERL
jgi:hypothetical protein